MGSPMLAHAAHLRRSLAGAVALAALTLACGAAPSWAQSAVTVANYTTKDQEMDWGYRSHWKQPWRSYMDTTPARTLLDAIGINFNVPPQWAPSTARLLADSGFKRARIEIGWNSVDYDDPTRLTAAKQQSLETTLTALRDNGIRPLILLNANHGEPCPVRYGSVTLTSPASASTRQIHIAPQDIGEVVVGQTGIAADGVAAYYVFKSVEADGTVQLSQPLERSLPAGSTGVVTLRYEPFRAETLEDGSPNPAFEETMRGWLDYVAVVTQEAKSILGSDEFDIEVWNELGFGSDFLDINNYYSPPLDGQDGSNEIAILTRTVQYVRDPGNGLSEVGIGNGFASERPWDSGSTSPVGLTAIDKHPYKNWIHFPEGAESNGNRPLNGLGEPAAGWKDGGGQWHEDFAPTYDSFFPEYFLSGIQTETLARDLSPHPSFIYDTEHGRFSHPAGGDPPSVWITEVNLDPTSGPTSGMSQSDAEHIKAKDTLRYLAAYVNKGVTAIDFYAADAGDLSLIDRKFFDALSASPTTYPGVGLGGQTTDAVRRLAASMQGAQPIASPRSLTLRNLTDYESKIQFDGDGTAINPPLYDRDVFAFLPFQVNPNRFVVPVYVMTRNVAKVQRPEASSSDPGRFDLLPETYRMTIGGVHGLSSELSATDPLTGEAVPVEVVSRTSDEVVVEMGITDSPRLLAIEDVEGPVGEGEGEGPVGEGEGEGPVGEGEGEGPVGEGEGEAEEPVDEGENGNGNGNGGHGGGQKGGPPAHGRAGGATPRSHAPVEADTAPRLRLYGGASLLRRQRLRLVAHCRLTCRLKAWGSVKVAGRSFQMQTNPHGAVTRAGPGRLTVVLRLNRRAARLARVAKRRGSPIKAVTIVQAQPGATGHSRATRRTLALQIGHRA